MKTKSVKFSPNTLYVIRYSYFCFYNKAILSYVAVCSKCCPLHTNVLLMNEIIIRDRHPLGIKEEELI